MRRIIPGALFVVVGFALAAVFVAVGVVPFNGESPPIDTPQVAAVEAADAGLGIASFETSGGAAYDAEAYTITRWHDVGVEVSNEHERLAFPWAVITKIELEAP